MARSPRRDDEDALDPVEAADQPTDAEEDDLDGFTDVDADEDAEDEDDDEDLPEPDFDEDDDEDLPEPEGDEDAEESLPLLLPDEELAAVVAETEDDDEADALKDGEFVCRSCFMAKRESALADPEAMLCRDCA